MDVKSKQSELEAKQWAYMAALENTNNELLNTLKQSVKMLAQFKTIVPDPQEWQEMLDAFQSAIKEGEKPVGEKTIDDKDGQYLWAP